MIEYKTVKTQEDYEKVKILCDKENMECPGTKDIIVAAFDGGEIIAVCGMKHEFMIEPIINKSIHALIPSVLIEKCFAIASVNANKIFGITPNKEHAELYKKYGAEVLEDKVYFIRKNV